MFNPIVVLLLFWLITFGSGTVILGSGLQSHSQPCIIAGAILLALWVASTLTLFVVLYKGFNNKKGGE